MKKKVVIFIDVVSHKNKLQIDAIINYGLIPHVFVATYKPSSDGYFINGGNQTLLITNGYKRIKQVNSYLQKNKNNIHHVEIYPGDRSAFFYLLLSKLYRIKCICVERGSLLVYQKNQGKATRFFMWLCYKFSDLIWYRELYMLPILKKINRRLYFLHNSIPMKEDQFNPDPSKKKYNLFMAEPCNTTKEI